MELQEKIQVLLTENPLEASNVEQFVQNDECGGIVSFIGTVRNSTKQRTVLKLEFEAYEPMAVKEMTKIAKAILEKWPVKKVAIHHRLGSLEIGEAAVIIAVSCPHRKNAFLACQYAIDTLKETVPIWKKEIFEDGEIWVSAHP